MAPARGVCLLSVLYTSRHKAAQMFMIPPSDHDGFGGGRGSRGCAQDRVAPITHLRMRRRGTADVRSYARAEATIEGLVEDDTLHYEIVTHFWQPHLTKISKLDADTPKMVPVAEIERVLGSTVRVRFGGFEDAREWINCSMSGAGTWKSGGRASASFV